MRVLLPGLNDGRAEAYNIEGCGDLTYHMGDIKLLISDAHVSFLDRPDRLLAKAGEAVIPQ
jgi:hypothetical protein